MTLSASPSTLSTRRHYPQGSASFMPLPKTRVLRITLWGLATHIMSQKDESIFLFITLLLETRMLLSPCCCSCRRFCSSRYLFFFLQCRPHSVHIKIQARDSCWINLCPAIWILKFEGIREPEYDHYAAGTFLASPLVNLRFKLKEKMKDSRRRDLWQKPWCFNGH